MTEPGRLTNFLLASSWSAGLTEIQLNRVRRDAFLREYQAGATVCTRGQPAIHWMGVVAGMLKVDKVAEDGRSTTFAGVPAGAWFGEGAVIKGELRPYAVVAIRDSGVAFLPRATFQWLIDDSSFFSRWVIDQLNARLAHYVSLVETSRFQEATARVAFCLSELFNPQLFPTTAKQLAISQEEIGRLSGLARQNTNKAIRELEDAGFLRSRYGTIEVLDLPGLQHFARTA
ncbi:Crp/Fnr family transcriptional regulator [Variovorax sp. J2L1-78]|nr:MULTISPECIES: Crp/Fnr family transcriptional regulator [unclassified Variovorax]MDM0123330.1 Crp/Fnr family transcriptional regulator [Variovorax sp. J2L1-78]MDM0131674.1 Crp/Fnr family transcriptional regulator [Variovorax sp. J2L1-63]MDM0236093.1 Crp/Fnr family transcriptional regulator [Variovorax sp. J2R1-6]